MKLRNKKTGEIWELTNRNEGTSAVIWVSNGSQTHVIESIEELANNFEDYEEPEEVWYIDFQGVVRSASREENNWFKESEIGNYFETKEEAEKVVEKLKALTEAKEDGLKIKGYYYNHEDLVILADIGKCNKLTLDTLFGKEID